MIASSLHPAERSDMSGRQWNLKYKARGLSLSDQFRELDRSAAAVCIQLRVGKSIF